MSKNNKKVVKSNTVLTAPNSRRLFAYLIDQIIIFITTGVIMALLGIKELSASSIPSLFAIVFLVLAYRILVPVFVFKGDNAGQTVGKRIMGIKVIQANGTQASLLTLLIRSMFMMVMEGFDYFAVISLYNAIGFLGFPQIIYLLYMNIFVGLVSIVLMIIRPSHQLLHDYVANTVTILVKQ